MAKNFFDERKEQSEVKSAIVTKYFGAWAKIVLPAAKRQGVDRLLYLDLFAGPGRYKDGSTSTPIDILKMAIKNPDLRESLVTIFNDADDEATSQLKTEIAALTGVDTLKYKPAVMTSEVGAEIVKHFEDTNLVPTLFFVDPWGYKGLSLNLINSVLKDWACECVFFFNYNRVKHGRQQRCSFKAYDFTIWGRSLRHS